MNSQDRILILAPHPDDEVLGCGGIIQQALELNIPIRIVFLTYGDNNQWSFLVYRKHPVLMPKAVQSMGLVRYNEALEAAKALGVSAEQLTFLGYPDFRTADIWYSHWGNQPPAKSMLTEVKAVPYANAFRPGAPYKGEEILQDLKTVLREFKPTKIFLSHPADHNSDHRSLYLFTRVALWDLGNELKPVLYPYMIHYKYWPMPRGYHPDRQIIPPDIFKKDVSWQIYNLGIKEIGRKLSAIKQHRSQYDSSAKYLLSFIRSNELFGDFPAVNLRPNVSKTFILAERKGDLRNIPEELIDEERAAFVGIEERSIFLENDNFVISIKLSRPLAETVGVSMYVFGYRDDCSFGEMPKIHIKFGALEHSIYDQNNKLALNNIEVERKAKEITIRIPLALLRNPQHILTSANTYIGTVPLDYTSWRTVEILNRGQ